MNRKPINNEFHLKTTTIFMLSLASAVVGGFILTIALLINNNNETLTNRQTALTNQTYGRVMACILSEVPMKRTDTYINMCYDLAEKETGIKVEHYGQAQ